MSATLAEAIESLTPDAVLDTILRTSRGEARMFYMQLSGGRHVVLDLLRKRILRSQSCSGNRYHFPRRTNSVIASPKEWNSTW